MIAAIKNDYFSMAIMQKKNMIIQYIYR